MKNRHKVAQDRSPTQIPSVFKLEEGFCDPATHHRSIAAVLRHADGTRVELAVRNAVDGFVCEGPRVERHQLLVSTPCRNSASVIVVQLDDLRKLSGVPEVLTALELFEAGDLTSAVRYVAAAGPRWAPLIDLLGGPR